MYESIYKKYELENEVSLDMSYFGIQTKTGTQVPGNTLQKQPAVEIDEQINYPLALILFLSFQVLQHAGICCFKLKDSLLLSWSLC